jgi:hypothetical protein
MKTKTKIGKKEREARTIDNTQISLWMLSMNIEAKKRMQRNAWNSKHLRGSGKIIHTMITLKWNEHGKGDIPTMDNFCPSWSYITILHMFG